MAKNIVMKNPRTEDIEKYIDCDLKKGGEWIPHTTTPNGDTKDKYERLKSGEFGEVEILPPKRNVNQKYRQILERGMEYNGSYLLVKDPSERERLTSAVIRYNINGTLPNNKDSLEYPTVDGKHIKLTPKEVINVSSKIQDFIESAKDRKRELLEDETLDVNKGWPP